MKDLRRHRARGRCTAKGGKKTPLLARYVPDTAEHRLALDTKLFADMGDDAPADFTGAHKRMEYKNRYAKP